MTGACLASGLIPSSILCTPVLNSYSAQPNFGAPASPAGSNPARPGGFPGANSPGPVADLYGPASQDSGVGNYISAASPQPGSGFGHGIAVSTCLPLPSCLLLARLLWPIGEGVWGKPRIGSQGEGSGSPSTSFQPPRAEAPPSRCYPSTLGPRHVRNWKERGQGRLRAPHRHLQPRQP